MFGFIIGTLCLFMLIGTVRRHHYGRFYHAYGMPYGYGGWGHGCGHGYGHGRGHHGFGGRRFGGQRMLLRALFERLDTTPGQEKAIMNAVETVRERMSGLREGFVATRQDIGGALEGELFDRSRVESAFARHDSTLAEGRETIIQALASIHAALDERQRKELGRVISAGPRAFFTGGACAGSC